MKLNPAYSNVIIDSTIEDIHTCSSLLYYNPPSKFQLHSTCEVDMQSNGLFKFRHPIAIVSQLATKCSITDIMTVYSSINVWLTITRHITRVYNYFSYKAIITNAIKGSFICAFVGFQHTILMCALTLTFHQLSCLILIYQYILT